MAQKKRKDFAHYLDVHITGTVEDYEREGIGVEALAMEYNAEVDTFKSILQDVADHQFKNYEITSSVQDKRIDSTDPIWPYLNYLRKHSMAGETTLIEADMTTGNAGSYEALKYNVLVTLNSFLGDDTVISYDIAINGEPKIGTVSFDSETGKPVFTEEVVSL